MSGTAVTEPQCLVGSEPAFLGVDRLPVVGANGTDAIQHPPDSAGVAGLRQAGVVKRGRGRPRKQLDSVGAGNSSVAGQNAPRVTAANWLDGITAHLDKADGLIDGQLPVKLAKAICSKADSMPVVDVVNAFKTCEDMALKLKAAKFLKDTSKGTIEELRKYALGLMNDNGEENNETS